LIGDGPRDGKFRGKELALDIIRHIYKKLALVLTMKEKTENRAVRRAAECGKKKPLREGGASRP
jgi:hypothetical protein